MKITAKQRNGHEMTYVLDGEMDLGEFRILKRHFDMPQMDALNPADPDHVLGLLFVAARRSDPALTPEQFDRIADTIVGLELEGAEDADADPQTAGSSDSSSAPASPATDDAVASS